MSDRPDPFSEVEQLLDEFMQFPSPAPHRIPVDVVDRDEEILVLADLPGRDPESIDVQLEDNRRLFLSTDTTGTDHDGRYVTRERSTDEMDRQLRLPAAVDEAETSASYDEGVLTVTLPKLSGSSDGTEIQVD